MPNPARRRADWLWKACAALGLLGGLAVRAEAGQTYLALGDSITFGVGANDSANDISDGDRGYVAGYADVLAARSGGARPKVVNLAVSGETSSSFFGEGVGIDGADARFRNLNYSQANPITQASAMVATIQSELAAGNTISTVTLSLGANDLFYTLATGGSFPDTLATFQQNEVRLLTQLRTLLPSTNLILLNYFDPYAPFFNDPDHTSPLYQIAQVSAVALPILNDLIRADAAAFGASYVDLYRPFQGQELGLTYIATGNVHPNEGGYALITTAVASVPEPGSVILLTLGLGVAGVVGRRRRDARPAAAT